MRSKQTSSLFPKQGDQDAKQDWNNMRTRSKIRQGETPDSRNHKATQNKNDNFTNTLEQSVA